MATGTGTAEVDFGAFPGSNEASVTVSATGVTAATHVEAWVMGSDSTTDHTAGSSLADYEAEWARKRAEQALEAAQDAPAQVRRRIKREAARKVYFDPLPDVAQVYVERLKAEQEAAKLAEMRALLDLAAQTSAIQADIARAAVAMAQKKRAEAERAIEEFDVMYVAAILAEA